jgi:toxin ParE1/3/4
MNRLLITIEASRDLSEIYDCFLAQSLDAGARFVEAFGKKCQYLPEYPYLGRFYAKWTPNLRGIPLMGYIIFYQIVGDAIEILRVISGYGNLQDVFNTD